MRTLITFAALASLTACATTGDKSAGKKSKGPPPAVVAIPKDPYPSTYKPYGGATTVLQNATVYDGLGGRIERGMVLIEGG